MKTIVAILTLASVTAASAHPSLIAHDHPHGISAFAGLDTLLLAVFAGAIALAAWKQVRS